MPYTPPSHRSPASSASTSPDVSRRGSLQSGSRPALPRSASYLNKHRRTPSVTGFSDGSSGPLTPQGTSEDLQAMMAGASSTSATSSAIRQSPPPMTDRRGMPSGAVISPPDSASSGSDDEGTTPEIRGRKADKLKDLRAAVSQISQARTPSPVPQEDKQNASPAGPTRLQISFSTGALGGYSKSSRRSSHIRSATEPNAPVIQTADNSMTASDDETDEDFKKKPQMVRKKSGELVRPALRPSHRRPSSMPGTPVFSKMVHFDSHLEHVRHFLQVDRPLAVSAGSSPADNHESDVEYPFPGEERPGSKTPPFEWELITTNFPHDNPARKTLPVKLEKVWLSPDQKTLLGSVAVANLAFQKSVVCRFTLDYWKTTSEVAAGFSHEIMPRETPMGYDRFTFSIKLSDTANLESKTLFFCIRYTVNGQEYWDNNNNANFQVDFRKKHLPMNGKNNFQGASSRTVNGLPRSNRRNNSTAAPRPKSVSALDDFGGDAQLNFDQPIHEYLGETGSTGLRLKTRSSGNLASDNIGKGLTSPSGAAFANRYDFGASLSAAVQAAKDTTTPAAKGKDKDADGLYMKSNVRAPKAPSQSVPPKAPTPFFQPQATPGAESPSLGLPSASYEELVNKYCFFGTKQQGPATKDSPQHGPGLPTSDRTGTLGVASRNPATYSPNSSVEDSPPQGYLTISNGAQPSASAGSFLPYGGVMSAETAFDSQPRVVPERFPWGGDAHAARAIRG